LVVRYIGIFQASNPTSADETIMRSGAPVLNGGIKAALIS